MGRGHRTYSFLVGGSGGVITYNRWRFIYAHPQQAKTFDQLMPWQSVPYRCVLERRYLDDWICVPWTMRLDRCVPGPQAVGNHTVTRRSAEFRHPARMTQDSSCYIGENDWFIWAGNLRSQIPKFSVITGNFRRFLLWKKEEYAWCDRTQYLWLTMPVLYP